MKIYPNKLKPIHYINKEPYLVSANIPIQQVNNPTLIKEWLGCDTAFRIDKHGIFIFCSKIEEVEFEEVENESKI